MKVFKFLTTVSIKSMAISIDIWLCKPQSVSYIVFNGILNVNGRLLNILLKFKAIDHPHTSKVLKDTLQSVLCEFKLQNKRIFYISDEGPNIVAALSDQTRLSCLSHCLHNFIKDWLKIDKFFLKIVEKGRKIVHLLKFNQHLIDDYYNRSKLEATQLNGENNDAFQRKLDYLDDEFLFEEYIFANHAQSLIKFHRDCAVRFNSIYEMLSSILIHKECTKFILSKLVRNDLLYDLEEWHKFDAYLNVLKAINESSKDFQQKNESSINLVLFNRAHLKDCLSNLVLSNPKIKSSLLKCFEQRFQVKAEHVIGSLIDPFCKNLIEINEYLAPLKKSKKEFIKDYASSLGLELKVNNYHPIEPTTKRGKLSTLYSENNPIPSINSSHNTSDSFDEIDKFFSIDSSKLDDKLTLIEWWEILENQREYPFLYSIAEQIIFLPQSNATSEGSFSQSGLMVPPNRSSLSPAHLSQMMFVKMNYDTFNQQPENLLDCNKAAKPNGKPEAKPIDKAETKPNDKPKAKLQLNTLINKSNLMNYVNSERKRKANKVEHIEQTYAKRPKTNDNLSDQQDEELFIDEMPEEERKNRIESLKGKLNAKKEPIDLVDEKAQMKANDDYDELKYLDKSVQIGSLGNNIVGNDEFVDVFQLYTSIKRVIEIANKGDQYMVMYSEEFTSDKGLVKRLNSDFVQGMKKIFVPVHQSNNHWILLVVDLEHDRSLILDSLKRFEDHYIDIMKRSFIVYQLLLLKDPKVFNLNEYKFSIVQDAPQQPMQSVDCGIYVLNYVQYMLDPNLTDIFNFRSPYKRFLMNELLNDNLIIEKGQKNIKKTSNDTPKRTSRSNSNKFMINLADIDQVTQLAKINFKNNIKFKEI